MVPADSTAEDLVALMLRLRGHGINDERLMAALEGTPRDRFVPDDHYRSAWRNETIPIACGQVMTSPDITARLVQAANVQPAHSVLEIGTGSGFQTAVLSQLAKRVHSLDRYRTLIDNAARICVDLGRKNISFDQKDGVATGRNDGLYDRIIANFAWPEMPRALIDRVTTNGIVITAIGEATGEQIAVKLTKIGSRFERQDLFAVRFGPPESGIARSL